jgi:hypothetical protein
MYNEVTQVNLIQMLPNRNFARVSFFLIHTFSKQYNLIIVHLHPVAHCYFTFTFLSVFCAAYRCF